MIVANLLVEVRGSEDHVQAELPISLVVKAWLGSRLSVGVV